MPRVDTGGRTHTAFPAFEVRGELRYPCQCAFGRLSGATRALAVMIDHPNRPRRQENPND